MSDDTPDRDGEIDGEMPNVLSPDAPNFNRCFSISRYLDETRPSREWFQQQFYAQHPAPDRLLYEIAREFVEAVKSYEQATCTRPGKYGMLPASPRENDLIQQHASNALRDAQERGREAGITPAEVGEAIRSYYRERAG